MGGFLPVGSLFQIGDGHSAETFTTLAEVNRISGLGWSRDMKDATTLADTYERVLPGLRKGDVITVDMNFTGPNWDRFQDLFETENQEEDAMEYRIVLKAGATVKYTWEFNGFVQSNKLGEVTPDNKQSQSAQIKITGAPATSSAGEPPTFLP